MKTLPDLHVRLKVVTACRVYSSKNLWTNEFQKTSPSWWYKSLLHVFWFPCRRIIDVENKEHAIQRNECVFLTCIYYIDLSFRSTPVLIIMLIYARVDQKHRLYTLSNGLVTSAQCSMYTQARSILHHANRARLESHSRLVKKVVEHKRTASKNEVIVALSFCDTFCFSHFALLLWERQASQTVRIKSA